MDHGDDKAEKENGELARNEEKNHSSSDKVSLGERPTGAVGEGQNRHFIKGSNQKGRVILALPYPY